MMPRRKREVRHELDVRLKSRDAGRTIRTEETNDDDREERGGSTLRESRHLGSFRLAPPEPSRMPSASKYPLPPLLRIVPSATVYPPLPLHLSLSIPLSPSRAYPVCPKSEITRDPRASVADDRCHVCVGVDLSVILNAVSTSSEDRAEPTTPMRKDKRR
ncbi:uncharacterized protein LOC126858984 [Cataglyphis hispanica]|uniref:uncharacterized protein LOC126858984 n=1 Tax=Cataglyphis hispanica TaxID=1086592 RepID=UPI0021802E76|nr:uncharacterized protein LOC126858984 [Cataglyphis hispanica]